LLKNHLWASATITFRPFGRFADNRVEKLLVLNGAVDRSLADGFTQTGNPGFTCAEGGQNGQFCDVTDGLFSTRTANFALAITGTTPAPVAGSGTGKPASDSA
jgi:hypothetical protein